MPHRPTGPGTRRPDAGFNFDSINDTGREAEGFEIDVEDVQTSDITRIFPARTCGMWNLTLDAVPLNLSRISHNPLALSVRLPDGSKGCVTVNNALFDIDQ